MTISIRCPTCGRELKLADRRLLGRKGKCPKCGNTFVLQETPDVDEQVVVESPVPTPIPTVVGPQPQTLSETETEKKTEVTPGAVDWAAIVKLPPKELPKEPAAEEPDFRFLENVGSAMRAEAAVTAPASSPPPLLPDFGQIFVPDEIPTRLKERQKKRQQNLNVGWIVGGVLGAAALVVVLVTVQYSSQPVPTKSNTPIAAKPVAKPEEQKAASKKPEVADTEDAAVAVDPSQTPYSEIGPPTHGTPIEMFYIPFGTAVVINLHPAELWKDTAPHDEIRKCVPPLYEWGESLIKQLFHCEPNDVEELLICLIPGTRGSPPEVSAVARMIQEQEDGPFFIKEGTSIDTVEEDVFTFGQRAYLLVDEQTFATCPIAQMDEMIKAMKVPHPLKQIDMLLPMTDHDREITLIVAPQTLLLNESWFPEKLRPFVKSFVNWIADDVDVISWSLHFRSDLFYSEILLRDREGNARKLEKTFSQKLKDLSKLVQSVVDKMNPTEQGTRTLIQRLPAMINVFSLATIITREPRHIQLVTPLPDRAAPNLILATDLAWDESTRTDFSSSTPVTEGKKLPPTIAERLKLPIDVDFRASPMSESFAYIGNEIGTKFELDGDALKAGGFTKNLKQSFKMENASVSSIIQKMFEEAKGVDPNPEKHLVLVIDEARKQVVVTTRAGAEKNGLTPTELDTVR